MRGCKIEQVAAALRTADEESKYTHGSGDGTSLRLHRELGIWPVNVNKSLDKLKTQGRAHIHCWTHSNNPAAVWVSGPGEDAPRVKAQASPESLKRYEEARRRVLQAKRETFMEGRARQITYESIDRARRTPQKWFSALEAA